LRGAHSVAREGQTVGKSTKNSSPRGAICVFSTVAKNTQAAWGLQAVAWFLEFTPQSSQRAAAPMLLVGVAEALQLFSCAVRQPS